MALLLQEYWLNVNKIPSTMSKLRTKNHGLPLIKPYLKKNTRNVRRWRSEQSSPVQVGKYNLKRVLDEVMMDDPKPKHELMKQYGTSAESALTTCVLPSLELLSYNPSSIFLHSASTLLHQLRRSLLDHDWKVSFHALQILIHSKLINRRLLFYVIRVSLILLFNHCDHPEILEEFLTLSLGITDETKIEEFLSSVFILEKETKPYSSITSNKA